MTERLYYDQQNLLAFEARVIEVAADPHRVYLDRTAFYPTSGGQPFDRGSLNGQAVVDVSEDEDGRIAHHLAAPWSGAIEVRGEIEAARRRDHQEQHTGQHLLSAVIHEHLGFATLSFHLGEEASTIDIAAPALTDAQAADVERWANAQIRLNLPVTVSYEDAELAAGLRKASERSGTLRIVTIASLDRSACGGTHVAATGEIGSLALRKIEKVRGTMRLEFLCGGRAQSRARRDFETLSAIARSFTVALDQAPAQVTALKTRLEAAEKSLKKLALEEATRRGRSLYNAASPAATGLRFIWRQWDSLPEDARAESQGFTSGERSVYLATALTPPAILLSVSTDSGLSAQAMLKEELERHGGRGGGSATFAQGTVPTAEGACAIAGAIEQRFA